jgi:formate dehydrogenase major subunit
MFKSMLGRWPLIRQLRNGSDGTGGDVMTDSTRRLRPRHEGADVARSICPYCGVGCGQLAYHRNGQLLAIEGDPESPISEGDLCPKGAASPQLITSPARLTSVKYRAPFATAWTDLDLEIAMDMVADRVWDTHGRTFRQTEGDARISQCTGIAHLGGATLDNEENYLIKKLFTGGLGMVRVSNQARI